MWKRYNRLVPNRNNHSYMANVDLGYVVALIVLIFIVTLVLKNLSTPKTRVSTGSGASAVCLKHGVGS